MPRSRPFQLAALALIAILFVCAPSAAAAVEPVTGPYEGKTDDDYVVSFEVREQQVFNLAFTVKWGYCGPAPVHLKWGLGIEPDGRFSADEGQWKMEGTFVSSTEVQGTVTFLEHPLAGCPEEVVSFTARLRTGPPPVIPGCKQSQLKISLYPRYPGAGYNFLNLVLDNRGGRCAVRGFPRLRLLSPGGRPLPTHTVHEGSASRVILEPKEAIVSTVRWDSRPTPGEAAHGRCRPVPHGLRADIPGGIVRRFPWHWGRVCKHGTLRVSAFGG